jgi:hypothetical protein
MSAVGQKRSSDFAEETFESPRANEAREKPPRGQAVGDCGLSAGYSCMARQRKMPGPLARGSSEAASEKFQTEKAPGLAGAGEPK